MKTHFDTTFKKGQYNIDSELRSKLIQYFTWCKSTGFYKLFQEEEIYFDDVTRHYLTIIGNGAYDLIHEQAKKLADKIIAKLNIPDRQQGYDIFIGHHNFTI